MRPNLSQFSGVVSGDAHNPTILNPDFLAVEGIVPESWGWKTAETFTTPPLAFVRYENDVRVTVEHSKFQVIDPNVENGPQESKVTAIASNYVRALPHVKYTAVGNNFQSLLLTDLPGDYLKALFLKSGPWSNDIRHLGAVGVRLVYPFDELSRLVLSIDVEARNINDTSTPQEVIVINANFHRQCGMHPAHDEVVSHLEDATKDWESYQQLLEDIFQEVR